MEPGSLWGLVGELLKLAGGAAVVAGGVMYAAKRYLDHRLETHLSSYRADLDRQAERLRFQLRREMLKAQLGTGRIYDVAPKLLVEVKKAHGAVASVMGLSFAPEWGEYDRADLERAFDDRGIFPIPIPSKQRRKLLEAWEGESPGLARDAREEVRTLHFRQQVGRARMLAMRAHNYAVLISVLLPADLAKVATDTAGELARVSLDAYHLLVEHIGDGLKAQARLEAFGARADELERRIRQVLAPAAAAMNPVVELGGSAGG